MSYLVQVLPSLLTDLAANGKTVRKPHLLVKDFNAAMVIAFFLGQADVEISAFGQKIDIVDSLDLPEDDHPYGIQSGYGSPPALFADPEDAINAAQWISEVLQVDMTVCTFSEVFRLYSNGKLVYQKDLPAEHSTELCRLTRASKTPHSHLAVN